MTPGLGRPRRATVVAPHPDDETIGAHGLMVRLRRRGATVSVVVVTDGTASHPGSARWPRARLAAERRRESRRAMRAIGVPASRVRFLALPDGAVGGTRRAGATIAAAVRRSRPQLLVGPACDDDHADHRAVAAALAGMRLPGARRLAYPVWPAGRRARRAWRLALSGAVRAGKRRALAGYRTQTGRIADDPAGFALTWRQMAAFSRPGEWFVEAAR